MSDDKNYNRLAPEQRAKLGKWIIELRRQGKTGAEIEKLTGVSKGSHNYSMKKVMALDIRKLGRKAKKGKRATNETPFVASPKKKAVVIVCDVSELLTVLGQVGGANV